MCQRRVRQRRVRQHRVRQCDLRTRLGTIWNMSQYIKSTILIFRQSHKCYIFRKWKAGYLPCRISQHKKTIDNIYMYKSQWSIISYRGRLTHFVYFLYFHVKKQTFPDSFDLRSASRNNLANVVVCGLSNIRNLLQLSRQYWYFAGRRNIFETWEIIAVGKFCKTYSIFTVILHVIILFVHYTCGFVSNHWFSPRD